MLLYHYHNDISIFTANVCFHSLMLSIAFRPKTTTTTTKCPTFAIQIASINSNIKWFRCWKIDQSVTTKNKQKKCFNLWVSLIFGSIIHYWQTWISRSHILIFADDNKLYVRNFVKQRKLRETDFSAIYNIRILSKPLFIYIILLENQVDYLFLALEWVESSYVNGMASSLEYIQFQQCGRCVRVTKLRQKTKEIYGCGSATVTTTSMMCSEEEWLSKQQNVNWRYRVREQRCYPSINLNFPNQWFAHNSIHHAYFNHRRRKKK